MTWIGIALTGFALALTASTSAQPVVRKMGSILQTSADSVRSPAVVRGLSNGTILINEFVRKRVIAFESPLSRARTIIDSAAGASSQALISAPNQTTYFIDWTALAVLVIDSTGAVVRTRALPNPSILRQDFTVIGNHNPATDLKGRVIYTGRFAPKEVPNSSNFPPARRFAFADLDSAPLLRVDFETRIIDTVAVVRIAVPQRVVNVTTTVNGNILRNVVYNPFPQREDEWAVMNDGTIAIIRGGDYRIEWVKPDDTRQITRPLPIKWLPLTKQDKEKMLLAREADMKLLNAPFETSDAKVSSGLAPRLLAKYELPAIDELPDFMPPVWAGSAVPSPSGDLWVPPRSAEQQASSLIYDVIDRNGRIVERVQLPPNRVLAGFISESVAILKHLSGTHFRVELANVR